MIRFTIQHAANAMSDLGKAGLNRMLPHNY